MLINLSLIIDFILSITLNVNIFLILIKNNNYIKVV